MQFQSIRAPNLDSIAWNKIWKITGPYKYKILLWNCAHRILPVAANLNRFIPDISAICSRCRLHMENHLHLFRDCPQSSILWSYIFHVSGISQILISLLSITQIGRTGLILI